MARITPAEAQKRIDTSRGMSRRQFNRLWDIARKGGRMPIVGKAGKGSPSSTKSGE